MFQRAESAAPVAVRSKTKQMKNRTVGIIGGGASGLMAAISAARAGAQVTLIEHMDRVGKKILSTGNGRCNLTNYRMEPECYRCSQKDFPMKVIQGFGVEETLEFFKYLGIVPKDRNGYVYPNSDQAASVLDVLRWETERLGIRVLLSCQVSVIKPQRDGGFLIRSSQGTLHTDTLILAAGSKAAPSTGSDGSGYELAKALGHKVIKPLPALVQLRCQGTLYKQLAGIRTEARIRLLADGICMAEDKGELQLTDYGLSGIPVFQISGRVSRLLYQGKEPYLKLDVMPDHTKEQVMEELLRRVKTYGVGRSLGDVLDGMLPDKLAKALLQALHKSPGDGAEILQEDRWRNDLADQIKGKKLHIRKVSDFDKAQVTTGGVALSELQADTLELIKYPGIYVTGELADVDGICGGYNLQWAWSSGHLAGQSAACALKTKIRSRS